MESLRTILEQETRFINGLDDQDDRRDAFVRLFNGVLKKLELLNYYLSDSEIVREYYIKDQIVLVFKREITGRCTFFFEDYSSEPITEEEINQLLDKFNFN